MQYTQDMEKKSAVLGAAGMLLVGGLAFGAFGIANADNQPAPTPVTAVTTEAPAPSQEPVVSEPVVEPVAVEPAPVVEAPAPVVVEPVVVQPAPVYVAPVEPAPAPVYVAPAPGPAVDSNGYITGGVVTSNAGGPGKVDLPSEGK